MAQQESAQRLAELILELETLKQSLPAHSLKPAMLIRIEELEEQIESLQSRGSSAEREARK